MLSQNGISPREFAIVRRPASGYTPCSFSQQRLWFLDRLSPGKGLYNIAAALRLDNSLEARCLEHCVNELVGRHESLRTIFRDVGGEPMQVVSEHLVLAVAVTDLCSLPEERREAEALRLATEEARRPFDLQRGPLLRVGLLQLSEQDQVLLVTMHHIISDGWSMEVFFRELAACYEARFHGRESRLAELPVQYADYAVWQREWLQGEELERQLQYWKKQLAGMEVLRLPTDNARPAFSTYEGSREFLHIDEATTAALKQLSQQENTTLFMTLLAVFQMLLYRYTGQQDIAVGTLTAGRNRAETEGLIGFFVNTLVLRTDLNGNPSFRELLGRVKETALGAYGHADLPFEKLVEEMHPQRDLSRNPLIQVTFQLFAARANPGARPQRHLDILRGVATFDMAFDMWEAEGLLEGRVEYSTDLFQAATVEQMLGHWETLARAVVTHPDVGIDRLPILNSSETRQQLVAWNQTARGYPCGIGIHAVFEARAARTPNVPALAHDGSDPLTYEQLNRRANRVAHALMREGAGRGCVFGILGERSVDTIVVMLGILKSGAAYLPLDPAWPKERRDFMLRDTQARTVISADWLPTGEVVMDESNPSTFASERDLAYILYTSGSTGRPKGVMVEHAALVNHAYACAERYGLSPADRVLQFASLGFDVAAEEIFATWTAGGCVVLCANPLPLPNSLADAAAGVTVLNLPAAYWHEWVDTLEPGNQLIAGLRLVVTGSDRVDGHQIKRWLDIVGDRVRLIHAYGVTEATITSLTFEVTRDTWTFGRPLPVGRPLGNVLAYVLDQYMNPVPAGVEGDLYLGGAGIARGYTSGDATNFVPSPFKPGTLYKTGDHVCALRDGNIVFLNRADDQIKIRGYRVEPREVEFVLLGIAGIQDAAVTHGDGGGLTAWVTADVKLDFAQVMRVLRSALPEYMVPVKLVQVPALPRTVGGKLDRSRLPAVPVNEGLSLQAYSEPAAGLQLMVAVIWQEALHRTRVGIDDNFFELGGHSLLLLRVHNRLETALGREIPIVELFRHPTVRSLAGFIQAGNRPPAIGAAIASRARLQKQATERKRVRQPEK